MTSATSGTPKPVVLSRRALVAAAAASAEHLGWQDDDRWLLCLPLAHVGGVSVLIRCLLARRTVVLADGADAAALGQTCIRQRVTLASFVPTQLVRLLAAPLEVPRSLRAALIGGAASSAELITRARSAGIPALTTYGMSETAGQVTTQRLSDPDTQSAGIPLPGVRVKLIDDRIAVSSPSLASGLALEDGFFVSDDLGRFDDQGRLIVLGRASDRIVSGGENVDPLEVERALGRCPGVIESCVFGISDAELGERVAAAVVADVELDPARLSAHCRQALASFKRPRWFARIDGVCLTPNGKLDRRKTAALARPLLQPLG